MENNDGHSSKVKGVVQSLGGSSIPKEFMTPGEDTNASIGRTIFRDDAQKNAFNIYYAQLKLFFKDEDKEIEEFKMLLNSAPAVEGRNREQALEGYVGILRDLQRTLSKRDKDKQKDMIQYKEAQPDAKEYS